MDRINDKSGHLKQTGSHIISTERKPFLFYASTRKIGKIIQINIFNFWLFLKGMVVILLTYDNMKWHFDVY